MGGNRSLQALDIRAFTLLEVLISMALLGTVLMSLYKAYTSQVDAIQTAQHMSLVRQKARVVLERMSRDLESAYLATSGLSAAELGFVGEEGREPQGDADRLDFTTLTHLPLTPGAVCTDLCEVGYSLEEGEEGEDLVLIRRDDPYPDGKLREGGRSQEICRGVTGLGLVYYDRLGREHKEWNTLSQQDQGLPHLVRIRFSLRDGLGKEHRFLTSVSPVLSGWKKETN